MRKVLDALLYHASDRPETVALVDRDSRLTYSQLAQRVREVAGAVSDLPQCVGVLSENSLDWVVTDLALAFAGKTLVPLPTFFSAEQLAHIVRDAGVGHVLCSAITEPLAQALGVSFSRLNALSAEPLPWDACRAEYALRVIYTSGTTGTPKGVRLGDRQISASACSLVDAIGARESETYLSVLPFSLLLEQITAIAAPLLVGGCVALATDAAPALAQGNPVPLVEAFERVNPNVSVLVPSMLAAWVGALAQSGKKAPAGLRFVAVGGAAVPENLVEAAWQRGIPAYVGYGLSECCSVVSVSREGSRAPGNAGLPLAGVGVEIIAGEIVVRGDTVMDGYLGGENPKGIWRTGDLGEINADGSLKVLGRKDSVLVTANGRNVSPEWIEATIEGIPAIARAVALLDADGRLAVLVAPMPTARDQLINMGEDARNRLLIEALAGLPEYAVPTRHAVVGIAELMAGGMLNAAGEPRRNKIAGNLDRWFSPSRAAQ